MSALFDILVGDAGLPSHVEVDGKPYLIITDFRHWMRVESTLMDADIEGEQKQRFLFSAFMPALMAGQIDAGKGYPFPMEQGAKALHNFYLCGGLEEPRQKRDRPPPGRQERPYDFKYDIVRLYTAFRGAYGIDLREERSLHWWVFCALFNGLPDTVALKTLMQARTQQIDKPTPAQKEAKNAIALPDHIRYFEPVKKKGEGMDAWIAGVWARQGK